ncbi:MAG: alpha-N-arabinofuranosidase [Terracidiphilus sp.]|nr:alpha-N-arabinofuranosidase [Terracidiphilus sp.]
MRSTVSASTAFMRVAASAALLLCSGLFGQTHPVNVTIDASKTSAPISKYVYGQFVELAGGMVDTSIWAEMLNDRKFYYPITSKAPAEPEVPAWQRRTPLHRWAPIGGDAVVTMDTEHPYVGDHTPRIALDKSEAHGIQQSGLFVRKGKAYTGRIVLSGAPGTAIKVSLVWGKDAADRQTVVLRVLTPAYKTFPLRFEAKADSDDASIEIAATGAGALHIAAVSLMPADNIQGFRADVIAALKQLHSGIYRFPGGNFISSYEWRDGIGDPDKRPPIWDPVWHWAQQNDIGTDEFLTLCRLLGVDPYITVNAGFGDAWSARELVEYTNGAVTTPMGKWRAANGHPAPYNVKLWGIGNEPWGDYQMGAMSTEQFAIKHNLFAKAMHQVDPSLKFVAGGAMPDVMTGADQSKRIGGKFVPDYLTPADWSGYMLAHDLDNIDMLSEHYYSSGDMHTDLKLEKKVNIGPQPLVEWERAPATQVRVKYEHYQEYLKRIPALRIKPVPIAIDEWAYMDMKGRPNSYKVVPAYAWAFHEMFRHSDLFQLGAFTFATAMMSETRTDATLNPTGLLFKMYRDHFGVIPVAVSGDSPQPKPLYPAGGDQPAVNPGSDTYPLDISAALSEDRKTLAIAVLNPSDAEQHVKLAIPGARLAAQGKLWRMAPDKVDAVINVGEKPGVAVQEETTGPLPESIAVPPFSVNIYSYAIQ